MGYSCRYAPRPNRPWRPNRQNAVQLGPEKLEVKCAVEPSCQGRPCCKVPGGNHVVSVCRELSLFAELDTISMHHAPGGGLFFSAAFSPDVHLLSSAVAGSPPRPSCFVDEDKGSSVVGMSIIGEIRHFFPQAARSCQFGYLAARSGTTQVHRIRQSFTLSRYSSSTLTFPLLLYADAVLPSFVLPRR